MFLRNSLLFYFYVLRLVGAKLALVPGTVFDRFITIWLENQDFDKVAADNHIKDLAKQGVLLTRYYAHTHPSQPNYLAAIGGDYFGLNHDGHVRISQNVSTIVDLLDHRNISWAAYFEDQPGPGFMGMWSDRPFVHTDGIGKHYYVRKHNPFVSYDSIVNEGGRLLQLDSFEAFQYALTMRDVPQFIFMSPNMLNDGHNTSLGYATDWSHNFLKPLLDDQAFEGRTLIMLTYDESEDYGKPNHIVTLLLGSAIPAALKGTKDDTFYTHYSILSTIQANWGLPNLGRYDVGANVVNFVAEATGYANREPANAATVNNSVSYPGMLNSGSMDVADPPMPNCNLIGAGKQPILDKVKQQCEARGGQKTPYDGSGNVFDGAKNLPNYQSPVKLG